MPDLSSILRGVWLVLLLATPLDAQEGALSVSIAGDRLALMHLTTGASVTIDPQIITEPGAGVPAIYLQSGNATLDTLAAAISATEHPTALVRNGDRFFASMPVVVLQGATLTMAEGDRLILGRAEGSYLLSLGRVEMEKAQVEAGPGRHPDFEGFRPFIAGLGQDSVVINDSTLTGLGYGPWLYSAGLFVSGRGILSVGSAHSMSGNQFIDLTGVVLSRLDGVDIRNTLVDTPRGTGFALRGIDRGIVEDLLVTNSRGSHALHISAAQGLSLQQISLENGQGKGLRIDDDSTGLSFNNMTIAGFDGSGATIGQGADCLMFEQTNITDNDGAGLAMRAAGTAILSHTLIARNDGPGLLIENQRKDTLVLVTDSTFSNNRMGLRAAGVTALRLHANDLSDQRPRLLSGDLNTMTPAYLEASARGGAGDLFVRDVRLVDAEPIGPDAAREAFQACTDKAGAN